MLRREDWLPSPASWIGITPMCEKKKSSQSNQRPSLAASFRMEGLGRILQNFLS